MIVALAALVSISISFAKAADEKPAKTKAVDVGSLKLSVPEGWKQKPQVREPRVAEFQIPGSGDDKAGAEYVVFFFGKQGAGGLEPNVQRWISQVEPEGRKVRTFTGESSNGKYTLVDLTGTYKKSMGPPVLMKTTAMPGWRVINVFVETESGPYFLKVDGPEKAVAAIEDDLRASFGAKKDSEKERKAE
jgi:gluconolactonase